MATIPITGIQRTSNWQWGSWARVGNKLFGTPWKKTPVLVLDLTKHEVSTLPVPVTDVDSTFYGTPLSSTVVNGCVYTPPFLPGAKFLLVVNASSHEATFLEDSVYMNGSKEHLFSAIVAVNTTLYLIPRFRSRMSLLSIDVGSSVPLFQDIPFEDENLMKCLAQSTHKKYGFGESLWFDALQVDGSLFTSPHDAECMLVYHTRNQTFEAIDTTALRRGASKWTRLLEAAGTLYAAPTGHTTILAVDVSTKEVNGISTGAVFAKHGYGYGYLPSKEWVSMVHHNKRLYIVPCQDSTYIAVVDLETKAVFPVQIPEQLRHDAFHFNDAIMVDDKMYALPAYAEAILVLDLNLEINGTEPEIMDEPDHEEELRAPRRQTVSTRQRGKQGLQFEHFTTGDRKTTPGRA